MEMVFDNTTSNLAEPLAAILLVNGICNNGMEMVFNNTPSNLAAPLTAILGDDRQQRTSEHLPAAQQPPKD